ncbi:MAG: hypothetical protein KI791_08595 [Cyclobacteriaceae bacterium]|nr:hypothetical protein [Cyclobacteriaceae bacterium SS2]
MKSITIHNIDTETANLIESKAKESGLSLNKTIKMLLHKALGISNSQQQNKESFKQFFGVWSQEEFEQFEENTKDFRKVDQNDW